MKMRILAASIVAAALAAGFVAWSAFAEAGARGSMGLVRGAGTTIIEGGTGAPSFTPVTTKLAFHWRNGEGHLECLALAPSVEAGKPASGNFNTNVMYVTGKVTSARVADKYAVLQGSAEVTGLGAGTDQPFTLRVTAGGPGATAILRISGLTFRETMLDGQIDL